MASHFLLVALVASILHVACATTSTTSVNLIAEVTTTAYNVLEKNNLPRGLLPNGVRSYTLNPEEFKFRFATTVGGVIRSGSIHEVYGVRVQVDRAGDQLKLQVQQFTQLFPVSVFSLSPSCS
ncbi:hypothetical protein PVAP13_6KG103500 [Panicum virgatum]|uniref:Uncharacterized protein n=1 Tax=Panicum virgatum TaxID=38727 RepID=A0A8T0RB10_PANVG|nr:hypothetical protein PVAP13_6KG103500 [Panicum virgatum]